MVNRFGQSDCKISKLSDFGSHVVKLLFINIVGAAGGFSFVDNEMYKI